MPPTLWLILVVVAIACAIMFLPSMHRVLRGILIAIAVILFVLWLLNVFGKMDGFYIHDEPVRERVIVR